MGKRFRKFVGLFLEIVTYEVYGLYGGSSLQEIFRKCLENPNSVCEMSGKCVRNVWKVSMMFLECSPSVCRGGGTYVDVRTGSHLILEIFL